MSRGTGCRLGGNWALSPLLLYLVMGGGGGGQREEEKAGENCTHKNTEGVEGSVCEAGTEDDLGEEYGELENGDMFVNGRLWKRR